MRAGWGRGGTWPGGIPQRQEGLLLLNVNFTEEQHPHRKVTPRCTAWWVFTRQPALTLENRAFRAGPGSSALLHQVVSDAGVDTPALTPRLLGLLGKDNCFLTAGCVAHSCQVEDSFIPQDYKPFPCSTVAEGLKCPHLHCPGHNGHVSCELVKTGTATYLNRRMMMSPKYCLEHGAVTWFVSPAKSLR